MAGMNKPEQEAESIKALTLWQPWASLIALGIKFIETRSWSTKYRGPLAIHAGMKLPPTSLLDVGDWRICYDRADRGARIPFMVDATHYGYQLPKWLQFGAVVATCELVDVVPIETTLTSLSALVIISDGSLIYAKRTKEQYFLLPGSRDVTDQLPYGDFSPGRFAWILSDINPLSVPIPAKGKQGLWELEMEVA